MTGNNAASISIHGLRRLGYTVELRAWQWVAVLGGETIGLPQENQSDAWQCCYNHYCKTVE